MRTDPAPSPNWALYVEAVTHRSWAEEHGGPFNQRLEFVGDAVLKLVVAEWLYELYPRATEGEMSASLQWMVSNENLARVARARGLGALLRLGRGADSYGDRDQDNPLADLVEALIGAVYLDQGLSEARALIRGMVEPPARARRSAPQPNPKGRLQEWCQARGLALPRYELVRQVGDQHRPTFHVEVHLPGRPPAAGEGRSKHAAEVDAATRALRSLDGPDPRCPGDLCE
jgi:ribonuclease-3